MKLRKTICGAALLGLCAAATRADESLPDSQVLLRAMTDELNRSTQMRMEDLDQPYFIHYDVDDSVIHQLKAEFGALTSAERNRARNFHVCVRIGADTLDNTNFTTLKVQVLN